MQPFGVLDRYIGKTIFTTIMMTLFMLVSLSGIIKFVDQLKKAGQGSYDALGAGMYTLLSVPKDVQIFFPMAALLGALLGLGMLAQRSELVVMQASGFTRMQVALSVMKTAIPLVLLTMAIGEWVAPQGEQMARNYRAQAMYGGSLLSTQQGLWAKDGNNFVYIERVKGDEELGGISIYAFNENRRLQSVRYAATAKFDPEHKVWRLSQVDESDLTNPKQITGSQTVSGTWKTNLTPDKLGVVALDPDALSISGLHNYVKYLKSSGQDAGRYQLNMWSKIFQPLSVAVMMLMALSFIFGPLRSVPMGVRVVTGISFGFVFYVLDQIFGPLTLVYGIPPIIGALLPSASFFLISLWPVNVVVEGLYEKYPDVDSLAAADVDDIEAIVRPCGLGRSKARDISACMKILRDEYGGKVPDDFDALLKLPGVGRKSANLIMGDVFGKPAIVTDTHCIRLVNRIGLVDGIKEPKKVEMALWKIIPPEEGSDFCHRLVYHGRDVCTARTKPYCDKCCLADICKKAGV